MEDEKYSAAKKIIRNRNAIKKKQMKNGVPQKAGDFYKTSL